MTKFFDIKLRDYICLPNYRNLWFGPYCEAKHDYIISESSSILAAEKAYFSYLDFIKTEKDKIFWTQYIFDLELELLEVLAKMEYEWVSIDIVKLKEIWVRLEHEAKKIEEEIYNLVWEKFNINSAKQVQDILFTRLKIPTNKKIKTWFSVDNEVLNLIAKDYAVAGLILEYRWLKKLQSTYIDWLLRSLNPKTKKIHTTYNQTQAATGRLSSENPNLQNIPSWDKNSDEIKSCFVPTHNDFVIVVADYSQVELRILANLSKDSILLDAFKSNEDIHLTTAKLLFPEETTITQELRRRAKTVNFWVIYGISWFGLSKSMNISPSEANIYIEKFYEKYFQVRNYYNEVLEKSRKTWFVETFFWRRRFINGLNDANRIIRWQAEREAINMPIQWTAADVIKIAMINFSKFLESWNYKSKMIMQVHDELVFEVHKDELGLMKNKIREIMENVFTFEIGLTIDLWEWSNWKEAK